MDEQYINVLWDNYQADIGADLSTFADALENKEGYLEDFYSQYANDIGSSVEEFREVIFPSASQTLITSSSQSSCN